MKKPAYVLIPVLFLTCFIACKVGKDTTSNTGTMEKNASIPSLAIEKGAVHPKESDPFDVDRMDVRGDTLILALRYGGGCKEHDFRLYTSGEPGGGAERTVFLYLDHDAHGDACKKMVHKNKKFDLSPLRASLEGDVTLELVGTRAKVEYRVDEP